MLNNKLDVKLITIEKLIAFNLCEKTEEVKDISINYTYTDQGRQMIILDIGAPVSVAGVPRMKQYL